MRAELAELADALRAAEGKLSELSEENAALRASNKANVKKVAALLEQVEALERQDRTGDAGSEEETAALREDLERLEGKLQRMREGLSQAETQLTAAPSPEELDALRKENRRLVEAAHGAGAERGEDDGFRARVTDLYEHINDLASTWRMNIELIQDYAAEVEEGFSDPDARDATHEALRDTLQQCSESAQTMKGKLREFRRSIE